MSRDDCPYSRVYWDAVDDPKFNQVWDDDHHLATWLRLLLIADQAWPASAALPRSARPASVKRLADVELIDLLSGDRYRIHGLDGERERRSDHARTAARARWSTAPGSAAGNAPSNPPGNAQSMLDEKRRDETSIDEKSMSYEHPVSLTGDGERDALDRYYELTMYRPWGNWSGDKLRVAVKDFGDASVQEALSLEHDSNPERKSLLDRTLARLARSADREREKARTTPRKRRQNGLNSPDTQEVLRELYAVKVMP